MNNTLIELGYNYNIFKLHFYRNCESMIANTNILLYLQLYIIILFRFFQRSSCYSSNCIILKYNLHYFLYKYLYYISWGLYCISNNNKTLPCLVLNIILNYIYFIYFIFFIRILPYIMTLVLIVFIYSTQKSNLIYFTKIYCGG